MGVVHQRDAPDIVLAICDISLCPQEQWFVFAFERRLQRAFGEPAAALITDICGVERCEKFHRGAARDARGGVTTFEQQSTDTADRFRNTCDTHISLSIWQTY